MRYLEQRVSAIRRPVRVAELAVYSTPFTFWRSPSRFMASLNVPPFSS